jgi:ubiquinone/menaquinone biosynthesis C-methylase UbiE
MSAGPALAATAAPALAATAAPIPSVPADVLPNGRGKNWDGHVKDVELMAATPGFIALRDRILELADLSQRDSVLDVGAGTGLLALAAAPRAAEVIALDASRAMCAFLDCRLAELAIDNTKTLCASASALPIAGESVDVVLSNYCFHHLPEKDKHRALLEIRRVLRPGGRLVFADMMFSLNVADRRDRAVIALFVKRMLRHGWGGLLRLLKNAARIATGRWEQPATVAWWQQALLRAGFAEVSVSPLEHEGGIAFARRPLAD